jgi:hypothetical protein
MIALGGLVNGSAVGVEMQELLISMTGTGWCLSTAQLTLSPDGGMLSGRTDGRKCPISDLQLARDWTKTQQWAVCSGNSVKDAMEQLARKEESDPSVRGEQALGGVLTGVNVTEQIGALLSVNINDAVFRPGTFTCSANFGRAAKAKNNQISRGLTDHPDGFRGLAQVLIPAMGAATPANRLFMLRKVAEGRYEVVLHPFAQRTYLYAETVGARE